MYELLALANEKLWLGHFGLEQDDGMPVFRHAVLLRGAPGASAESLEDMVDIALTECERFFPGLPVRAVGRQDAGRRARRGHAGVRGRGDGGLHPAASAGRRRPHGQCDARRRGGSAAFGAVGAGRPGAVGGRAGWSRPDVWRTRPIRCRTGLRRTRWCWR